MKPLLRIFLTLLFSIGVTTAIAANVPDPAVIESSDEISIDETIKIFIQDLCDKLTLEDYIQHESAVEALIRCSQRIENNVNSLLLQDLILAYPLLLARYQELVNELSNDDAVALKAPREEIQPFIVGPGACNTSSIKILLNTISTTLNQCCQQIENNFITTFSELTDIALTISVFTSEVVIETVSVLVNTVNTLVTTVSTLVEVTNTLTTIVVGNFQGTFSALAACCNNITSEFQQTWTILAALNLTATTDLTAVLTTLDACCTNITSEFQQTWTMLAAISTPTIVADLTPLFTAINAISACFATSVTGPTTITQSGYYCLANNVTGTFIIAADEVVLDLNSHTITAGGVVVQTGVEGATIRNGTITNSTTGIMLNNTINATVENVNVIESPGLTAFVISGSGTRLIDIYIDVVAFGISGDGVNSNNYLLIDGLTLANATGTGIVFNGNGLIASVIKNSTIANCGSNGIVCEGPCAYNTFSNIAIDFCNQIGLYFFAGTSQHIGCNLINVAVNALEGVNSVAGILATNPINFRFESCAVRGSFGPTFSFFSILQGTGNVLESCLAVAGTGNFGFQIGSSQTVVKNCQAMGMQQNAGSLSGFYSNALNNQFNNCTAGTLASTTIGSPTVINGFFLDTGAINNLIVNCQAINIQSNLGNAVGFYSNSVGSQMINCTAEQIFTNFANSNVGLTFGFLFDLSSSNNSCINCNAVDIQNTVNATNNNPFAFATREATATTFYNCIADNFGNVNLINEAFGFSLTLGSFTTLVNCSAVNSNGTGFELTAAETTVINCKTVGNFTVGFVTALVSPYVFRDCTSAFNPGGGFVNNSGPGSVASINCYGAHNTGGNFVTWPNVQVLGAAAPVVGVNISA